MSWMRYLKIHLQQLLYERNAMKEKNELQVGLAFACRLLGDYLGCPPECDRNPEKCKSNKPWLCWQKYIKARTAEEAVCRVCGCTQHNACPGGCYWVEDDLCSACADKANVREGSLELASLTEPIHHLKIVQEYYDDSAKDIKTFEIRKNDRDYAVGDILHLQEWTGNSYTGRSKYKRVLYILRDRQYVPEGYACMSTRLISSLNTI